MGQLRPETSSDADLVHEARRGFKDPMAELLRRHWDIAVLLAGRVLGSPDRFGAWFCGIALNVSRRWLRQLHSEVPGPQPDLASVSPDPAEAAEIADTAARVRSAIAELADGQQDAVRLFYLQGLSHREVAGELGISAGAVKARLHQARAALAPRLAQFVTTQEASTVTATEAAEWAEVSVSEIRRTEDENVLRRKYVMILAERGGDRRLPLWIGPVEAAGSQITEVRITRLLDSVFYACVVVQGPGGPQEVDARPSDAVNLAVACDAPIRLNSELFGVVEADDDAGESSSYPVTTADIAAETQQRMREAAQRRAQRSSPPPEGNAARADH